MLRPDFCTTVSPDEYDCIGQFEQAVKEANKYFKKFIRKMRIKYGNFAYLAAIEFQKKSGRVHYHVLWNLDYIKQKKILKI